MYEDASLDKKRRFSGILSPTRDHEAANKEYVDKDIAKLKALIQQGQSQTQKCEKGTKPKHKKDFFTLIDVNRDRNCGNSEKVHKFYPKKFQCYNEAFKRNKERTLAMNVVSSRALISATAVGGISLNPILLSALLGFGTLLAEF